MSGLEVITKQLENKMKDCFQWNNGDVYVNKCKYCKYFKNDCEFASVNKQLDPDGNFVAFGQFEKTSVIRDCLSCSNSFSEEGNLNGDIIHCMEQNEKVVDDDFYCNNWN